MMWVQKMIRATGKTCLHPASLDRVDRITWAAGLLHGGEVSTWPKRPRSYRSLVSLLNRGSQGTCPTVLISAEWMSKPCTNNTWRVKLRHHIHHSGRYQSPARIFVKFSSITPKYRYLLASSSSYVLKGRANLSWVPQCSHCHWTLWTRWELWVTKVWWSFIQALVPVTGAALGSLTPKSVLEGPNSCFFHPTQWPKAPEWVYYNLIFIYCR